MEFFSTLAKKGGIALRKINAILSKLSKGIEYIMISALVVMVVVMFAQVVLRYVFRTGFPWTEELSRFLMIYLIFLGAVVLTHDDSHINITILDGLLKGKPLKVLKGLQYLIGMVYSVLITKIGFNSLTIVSKQKSPNMRITMDKIYMIIPICCALMVIYMLFKLLRLFTSNNEVGGME